MLLLLKRKYPCVCIMGLLIYSPITLSSNWQLEPHVLSREEIDCKNLPDSHSNVTELYAALLKYNINTAWLNIRRVREEWKWLDGSGAGQPKGSRGRHQAGNHKGCALLDTWNREIYAFQCHLPTVAICQTKDCRICKQKPLCQPTRKYCHYIVNATSWFHARSQCSEYEGSRLAVLSHYPLRNRVSKDLVNSEVYQKYRDYFWVGLHQEDWKDDDGKGKSISSSRFQVLENAFSSPGGECLVVKIHENKLVWRIVHCSEKHHVLCRKKTGNQSIGMIETITPIPSVEGLPRKEEKVPVAQVRQEISSAANRRILDSRLPLLTLFYLSCSANFFDASK